MCGGHYVYQCLSLSLSLSQLQCPYVVQLLGARVDPCRQVCALVCEKMSQGCLYLLLHVNKTSMEWGQRLRIVRDICSGMAFIHSHQILHRNLLPQNILVSHVHQLHDGNVHVHMYITTLKQYAHLYIYMILYMYMYERTQRVVIVVDIHCTCTCTCTSART